MAQTKPQSSRSTATAATCDAFPRETKRWKRRCSRSWAFLGWATIYVSCPSQRCLMTPLWRGGRR